MPNLKRCAILIALASLAGCQSMRRPAPVPEPPLTLLSASTLDLPQGCIASGAFTVTFIVAATGETRQIRALDAPACVDEALTAVASVPMVDTIADYVVNLVRATRGAADIEPWIEQSPQHNGIRCLRDQRRHPGVWIRPRYLI